MNKIIKFWIITNCYGSISNVTINLCTKINLNKIIVAYSNLIIWFCSIVCSNFINTGIYGKRTFCTTLFYFTLNLFTNLKDSLSNPILSSNIFSYLSSNLTGFNVIIKFDR